MLSIIGHGDIASALEDLPARLDSAKRADRQDRKEFLFFASGVSNSREKRQSEFQREIDLLLKQDKSKHLVYFSSLCIFYSKGRYAQHKRKMEELVRKKFKCYTIIRMGNITWGKNPHTLLNYLKNRAQKGKQLKIQDTFRYLVDKDEFLHWMDMIPKFSCEMNITGQRLKVAEVVKKYIYTKKRRNA